MGAYSLCICIKHMCTTFILFTILCAIVILLSSNNNCYCYCYCYVDGFIPSRNLD